MWKNLGQLKQIFMLLQMTGETVFNINGKKYTYFLEVFIINELFEDMEEENITFEKKCQLIIEYAINDA